MPGTVAERTTEQATSRGNGPDGRRLRNGEMVPLTAEQSERLAVLFEQYADRLLRYLRTRLMNRGISAAETWSMAEDLAQDVWIRVARTGAKDLLSSEPLTESATVGMLFVRAKCQLVDHFRRPASTEKPVDWQDDATCRALGSLLPSNAAMAELSGELADVVAALPEQEQAALTLKLDGLSLEQIGERMGCQLNTARLYTIAAVLLLRLSRPELSGPPAPVEELEGWEREALGRVSTAQREALLRVGDGLARRVLLLNLADGLSSRDAARTLGVTRGRVLPASRCVKVLRSLAAEDMEQAA